ncbi:hypothetical protein Shyd_82780 [Streptomyces hydrogenans]|uniref:Uncharacterized protein n=1 Tax=Streptomyces hydrogenans TaxID=1873719 RepID=A0ABQ3PLK7_9ACTN|nr:hypothetical protein GCM10018784_70680 [Streptomyces hydrogenans]GHI22740.1 hypothetical protein Shyd_41110 [Streptomyces hydrogenans]GHI24266.1 hypothetical protein Shyd_56370 [Streptomyces hydrogenans]GHI24539.1 hypothetical protein Shyd_59100 [Streptomyces hydrogenans]GHI24553.1 hypothetical protein Shyd_59240 [Streptomyces hydrogenans]
MPAQDARRRLWILRSVAPSMRWVKIFRTRMSDSDRLSLEWATESNKPSGTASWCPTLKKDPTDVITPWTPCLPSAGGMSA